MKDVVFVFVEEVSGENMTEHTSLIHYRKTSKLVQYNDIV